MGKGIDVDGTIRRLQSARTIDNPDKLSRDLGFNMPTQTLCKVRIAYVARKTRRIFGYQLGQHRGLYLGQERMDHKVASLDAGRSL